jgi:hypothetical protein
VLQLGGSGLHVVHEGVHVLKEGGNGGTWVGQVSHGQVSSLL